jgi:histidine triad (HIT) family protein
MSTIFTKIIEKQIPADILFEDDRVIAFRDINPQAPIHFLVIPKKPIATTNDIQEVDEAVVGYMHRIAARIVNELGAAQQGFRTVMNCNEDGGQTVYHIHLHVLAGKALGWPPYSQHPKTN